MTPLAGDASKRRYFRLKDHENGTSLVLMDAPPESGEDISQFLKMARYFKSVGLSAPEILHADCDLGLAIIEDLGDDLFARVALHKPSLETGLYEIATDLLVNLHTQTPPKTLGEYGPAAMTEQSALIFDWYLKHVSDAGSDTERRRFTTSLSRSLAEFASDVDVLVHRDYHSENLLWLPHRAGLKRVGILDFQDALRGHRMYDLVSLLQDARRDVPREIERAMQQRYASRAGIDPCANEVAYATLGAQRNLRILGVFTRLAVRDAKPNYIDLMPRVWKLLQRNLEHPALSDLRAVVLDLFPAPDEAVMNKLRHRCSPNPMPS